ncbi:MAG TPA: hypothetical protein ENL03_06250 [Phycisphaerae bacterium]|nr:hypothetical protein [Phycisphaerae bacterium]
MKHNENPDIEMLICMYIDGELPPDKASQVAKMIANDPNLAEQERLYRSLDDHLRDPGWQELEQEDIEIHRQDIIGSIERKVLLDGQSNQSVLYGVLSLPWLKISAAAAAVLLAAGVYFWLGQDKIEVPGPVITSRIIRDELPAGNNQVVESVIRRPSWEEFAIDVGEESRPVSSRLNFNTAASDEDVSTGKSYGLEGYPMGL